MLYTGLKLGRVIALLGLVLAVGSTDAVARVRLLDHHARTPVARTLLVSPSGQPVGGKWQRWIDAAKVPTYAGVQILDLNLAEMHAACVNANGCSAPAGPCIYSTCGNGHPESWLMPDDTRDGLYYEHGHILDFAVATDRDRAAFMAIWRLPGTVSDWWRNDTLYATTNVHPPGELWSAAYQLCALGISDRDSIAEVQGRLTVPRWAPAAQRASCRLFRHLT